MLLNTFTNVKKQAQINIHSNLYKMGEGGIILHFAALCVKFYR